MFGVTTSDDYQPITWVGRHPVHVTTLLVAFHTLLLVLTCFLSAFGGAGFLNLLIFDSAAVIKLGYVWQIITYAFVHVPYSGMALLWFAFEMYMLLFFGREVERFIGRRAFIGLYALVLVIPTLFLTVTGLWMRLGVAGSMTLHFGIFIAFAVIHPQIEMLLRIQAKWVALVLIAIGTLAALANHDWASIIMLWTTIGTAFVFIRLRGAGPEFGWWTDLKAKLQPRPKFQVVRDPIPRRTIESGNVHESIDPILEKISREGMGSLTVSEKRALERARTRYP